MTAAVLPRPRALRGLRRIDPRRDLAGLGRVIERAFAERLDDSGRRMTQSMRSFGRWGWLGWAAGHLFLPPAAYPEGYVWLEDGRIVGNASLMRVDEAPKRWVLINVAVEPAWRRRGIASSLVQACIEEASRRGAKEILLQVDATDGGAQGLYTRFGFTRMATRATWSRIDSSGPPAAETLEARSRRPEDSAEHLALVQRLHPEGLLWPRPVDADAFRRTQGFDWGRHWVWPKNGPIRASLSAFHGYEAPGVLLVLALDGEARGQAEAPLLDMALANLPGSIRLEASDDADGETLRRFGFRLERRLVWMALKIEGTKAPGRQGTDETGT